MTILGLLTLQLALHHQMNWENDPNVDGDDYEVGGKYYFYKRLLLRIRRNLNLPEDIKARRIESMKSEIIPFW